MGANWFVYARPATDQLLKGCTVDRRTVRNFVRRLGMIGRKEPSAFGDGVLAHETHQEHTCRRVIAARILPLSR